MRKFKKRIFDIIQIGQREDFARADGYTQAAALAAVLTER